jgi:hypothetical protein
MKKGVSMASIVVSVDEKWERRVRSPLYGIVEALSGVAITFAPGLLYYAAASDRLPVGLKSGMILLAVALIFLVPLLYMSFARSVIRRILTAEAPSFGEG